MLLDLLRRWTSKSRASFPAGGALLLILVGYYFYKKTDEATASPVPLAWRDIDGVKHKLNDFDGYRATAFLFLSAQCPCADAYASALAGLAKEYGPKGVRFFAVFSNGDESTAEIRSYVDSRQLGFPAVKDERGVIARQVKLSVTPSVVVIDAFRAIAYHGGIGEPIGAGKSATRGECQPLVDALEAVLAGKHLPSAFADAAGCAIIGAVTAGLPPVEPHDNRVPAGRLEGDVLHVQLVAETGLWRPEKGDGAGLPMHVFREEGKPLSVPGPLIRVPQGTEVRLTVRNALPGTPLKFHGLLTGAADGMRGVRIASGEERELRWKASEPGTFLYWASTAEPLLGFPSGQDALLNGGLIVDSTGSVPDPEERVFVLHQYMELAPDSTAENRSVVRGVLAINGLTWPYTERLSYGLGERVRWRIINASFAAHPMHLHGFYFDVLSRSDGFRETRFPSDQREKSVT